MWACFVIYDYYFSYTDNILHSKRLTYWKYIYCLFFPLFRRKKKPKKYIFLKCRPLWKNRDSNPPDLTCCLPLSWFVLDSPDLFWKQGKQLLILRSFLWCECETLCITLSYPIISLQVSPLNTAIVSKCSKCCLRRIKFAKFPGWTYPRSLLEAHT